MGLTSVGSTRRTRCRCRASRAGGLRAAARRRRQRQRRQQPLLAGKRVDALDADAVIKHRDDPVALPGRCGACSRASEVLALACPAAQLDHKHRARRRMHSMAKPPTPLPPPVHLHTCPVASPARPCTRGTGCPARPWQSRRRARAPRACPPPYPGGAAGSAGRVEIQGGNNRWDARRGSAPASGAVVRCCSCGSRAAQTTEASSEATQRGTAPTR